MIGKEDQSVKESAVQPEEVIEEYLQSDPGFDIIYFQKLLHPQ